MKRRLLIWGLLLVSLLLALPVQAAEQATTKETATKDVGGVIFPLPEDWEVGEELAAADTATLVLLHGDGSTAVAVLVAPDAGLPLGRIAEELASVTGATAAPVERDGQASFSIREEGQDGEATEGICFVRQSQGRFLFISVLGDPAPAIPLLEGMRCPADPGLVLR